METWVQQELRYWRKILTWTVILAVIFGTLGYFSSSVNDYQANKQYLEQKGLPPIEGRPGTGLPPQRR